MVWNDKQICKIITVNNYNKLNVNVYIDYIKQLPETVVVQSIGRFVVNWILDFGQIQLVLFHFNEPPALLWKKYQEK